MTRPSKAPNNSNSRSVSWRTALVALAFGAAACSADGPFAGPSSPPSPSQVLAGCLPARWPEARVDAAGQRVTAKPYVLSYRCGAADGFAHAPAPPLVSARAGDVLSLTGDPPLRAEKAHFYATIGVIWSTSPAPGPAPQFLREEAFTTSSITIPRDLAAGEYLLTFRLSYPDDIAVWFALRVAVA